MQSLSDISLLAGMAMLPTAPDLSTERSNLEQSWLISFLTLM